MSANQFELPAWKGATVNPFASREVAPQGWQGPGVPNLKDWKVGDIVLVDREATPAGYAIQAMQAASFSPVTRAGCRWSHAALYLGSGNVVSATFRSGVTRQSLWDYCATRGLRVRRMPLPLGTLRAGQDAASFANSLVGQRYSVRELIRSKLVPQTRPDIRALYCSTFVGLVWAEATGFALWHGWAHKPLYPAVLAMHDLLEDIPLEWRHI